MKTVYMPSERLRGELVAIQECSKEIVSQHSHSFFEFVYVVSGQAEHTIDGRCMILSEGDYFLIDLKSTHSYRKISASPGFSIINCLFLPSFIDASLERVGGVRDILDNYLVKFGNRHFSDEVTLKSYHDSDGFVGKMMYKMLEEYTERKKGYREIIRNLLVCMLVSLVRHDSAALCESNTSVVAYIKEYVYENYMRKISLSEIAKELNFSLTYVSLVFKRESKTSFRDYLAKVRMEKACNLLCKTDKTISEIAGRVGYTDDTFFYKSFKSHIGVSPSAYRERCHNKKQ